MATKNNNLQLIPAGPVEWPAVINDLINKYEVGRTISLVAGETIAQYKGFRIDTGSGKAYKSDSTSINLGLWQSTSTAPDATGFGQISGTVENGGWTWTPGTKLYMDNSGDLTDSSALGTSRVAIAVTATEVLLLDSID